MDLKSIAEHKEVSIAFRFLLLIALPFLLGFYVFPHTAHIDGNVISTPIENRSASEVLSYSFSPSSDSFAINQGVNSVFPLSNYLDFAPLVTHDRLQLCFNDNGSSVILPNGTQISPDLLWTIHINNDTPIILPSGKFACSDIPSNQPVIYAWTAKINTGLDSNSTNGAITFNPQTVTYPRQVMDYGLLQGIVMIPAFYLFIWYPLFGILKKLREGIMAQ